MESLQDIQRFLQNNHELLLAVGLDTNVPIAVEPLGKGEHNENYVFGEQGSSQRFVLRINRIPQPFHSQQVAYEFAALTLLEQSGCTPQPLFCDTSCGLGKGILVESFCAGKELDFDKVKPHDLQKVAKLMAQVHAVPVSNGVPPVLFCPNDPLKQLFNECVDRFSVYKGTALEDARFTRWIECFFKKTQEKIDSSAAPCAERHIINTETLPSHFLLPEQDASCREREGVEEKSTLGTFVDWERPIMGEVAQDLAFFVAPSTTFWDSNYLFPRDDIQSFLDEYWRAVDGRFSKGNFEERFDAYLAVSVLRSQTWFCKNAARYAQGANAHTVQRTFDKWDIYTSDEFNEMLLRECF